MIMQTHYRLARPRNMWPNRGPVTIQFELNFHVAGLRNFLVMSITHCSSSLKLGYETVYSLPWRWRQQIPPNTGNHLQTTISTITDVKTSNFAYWQLRFLGPPIRRYLPAVFHGDGTQFLSRREEHRFRVLNSTYGGRGGEAWRILVLDDRYKLIFLPLNPSEGRGPCYQLNRWLGGPQSYLQRGAKETHLDSQGNGPIRHIETCLDFFFHCKSTHNKIHCQNSSC
jgi:hypothetical protein